MQGAGADGYNEGSERTERVVQGSLGGNVAECGRARLKETKKQDWTACWVAASGNGLSVSKGWRWTRWF